MPAAKRQTAAQLEPLIRRIEVDGLFGRYNYRLNRPDLTEGPNRLMLLHGDNGSGKTTVLRSVWHLLSPADDKGHKTALARTPLRRLAIELAGGATIEMVKTEGLVGDFTIEVTRRRRSVAKATYIVDADMRVPRQPAWRTASFAGLQHFDERGRVVRIAGLGRDDEISQEQVGHFLADLHSAPYMLADDRNLQSDDVDSDELNERERYILEREVQRGGNTRNLSTSRELSKTIERINAYLQELTLGGQDSGSVGTASIYKDILQELAGTADEKSDQLDRDRYDLLFSTLRQVAQEAPRYSEYGLTPRFESQEFEKLIKRVPGEQRTLAANIILPYLESLTARFHALADAERIVRLLVTNANEYLVDKRMTFTPREGLLIRTDDGEQLGAENLSSGERQLVHLLCTTFLAGRNSRLFIIDEPELSLGVPWQRKILDSLLACTEGGQLQFLVATHSVEMITSNRDSLVRLARIDTNA